MRERERKWTHWHLVCGTFAQQRSRGINFRCPNSEETSITERALGCGQAQTSMLMISCVASEECLWKARDTSMYSGDAFGSGTRLSPAPVQEEGTSALAEAAAAPLAAAFPEPCSLSSWFGVWDLEFR